MFGMSDRLYYARMSETFLSQNPNPIQKPKALTKILQIRPKLTFNVFHILNHDYMSKIERKYLYGTNPPPQKKAGLFFWGGLFHNETRSLFHSRAFPLKNNVMKPGPFFIVEFSLEKTM